MNALDWIFAGLALLLGIRCMVRGFVEEILSVAAVLVGLLSGLILYKPAGQLLVSWGIIGSTGVHSAEQEPLFPNILGFIVSFLLAFLLVKIIEKLASDGLEETQLGSVNRFLGFLLGILEAFVLISLLLVLLDLIAPAFKAVPAYARLLKDSVVARTLLPLVGPELAKAAQGIKLDKPLIAPQAFGKP